MANNDPVLTPIFVSWGVTGALTIGSASITYASILSTLVVTASLAAASYLLAPRPPRPGDGNVVFKQPVPERIYAVGTNRIGGNVLWFAEKNNDFHICSAFLDAEYTAIVGRYLNDDVVTLINDYTFAPKGLGGNVAEGEGQRYGGDNGGSVIFEVNYGHAGVPAFPGLIGFFPDELDPDETGSNEVFSCTGFSAIRILARGARSADFARVYPNGRPEPSVVAECVAVFDMRDPAQDVNDPSTWQFSKNVALCWLWYECFCPNGPRKDYTKAILPVLDIWIEEADICDEQMIDKDDNAVPRYEINYWWRSGTTREAVRAMFIACCDGWLCERGDGTTIIRVGKYREPTVTITDDMIVGYYTQRDQAIEDRINTMVLKFTSPEEDYGEVEADPIRDEDAIAVDGAVLSRTLDIWGVQNLNQLRRLGRRDWIRQNEELRGSLTLNFLGTQVLAERWLRVTSERVARLADQIIEVRGLTMQVVDGSIGLEYVASGPHIDTYVADDPETGDGETPPSYGRPGSIHTVVPQNVGAVAAGDPPWRLIVSWDEISQSIAHTLTFDVRYRQAELPPDGVSAWSIEHFDDAETADGRSSVTIYPASEDSYEIQVRTVGQSGEVSAWSESAFASVTFSGLDFSRSSNSAHFLMLFT